MHDGWLLKRTLASGITNDRIDEWYSRARVAGATGGKLLGAGGGGFLLFYVPPERRADVVASLSELRTVDFQMAPQDCKIIYVE